MPMPSLALLIAKKKPSMDMDEKEPMDDGDGHDKEEICQKVAETLIDAIHDRDAKATCKCLKDLIDLLKDGDDEEEAGDDGEDGSY